MSAHDLSLTQLEALFHLHSGQDKPTSARAEGSGFTITFSREVGVHATPVAQALSRQLGWPVYDRDIIDRVADDLHQPTSHVESHDERPSSWLAEQLSLLFGEPQVSSEAYRRHLFLVLRGLGARGHCIIVGRGSTFVLPPETTLRIRLFAPLEDRIAAVAQERHLSEREAAAWIEKTQNERCQYVRKHFHLDPMQPRHFDLMLNMSRLSVDDAAALILAELRQMETRANRKHSVSAQPEPALSGV
jgi:Cytidylate kinase-like family